MDAKKIDENLKKYLKGTTTVGIVCDEGVVVASDSRATMGFMISDKEARKIYKINDKLAMTTAGMVGDNQTLVRIMRAQSNLQKMEGDGLSVKMAATLLANILNQQRYFPFLAQVIIGGHDKKGGHVFELDPVGGISEKNVASTGSGSPVAYGVLEREYKEGISIEEGKKMAAHAINSALERDAATGNNVRIVVIDKDGYKEVEEKEIKKLLSE
ncbi:MAG: archaeal proteasome endopeptidase complex subunit beta [Candidatus Undinarchaeales archaeon]